MISRTVVYCAYYLKNARRYNLVKRLFYDLLENPDSRAKKQFDVFMIFLVMFSVFVLVYRVEHEVGRLGEYLEHGVVTIFIIEYLLRGWLYSDSHRIIIEHYEKAQYLNIRFSLSRALRQAMDKKLHYVFSPLAIIDLLAILPSYRSLRILRIFLIFRLFKLFRYSNSIKVFADVLASKRFELITLMVFMGFLVFIASIGIYLFENKVAGGHVDNLYDALYWSIVTISTVGYGDIAPQTVGGRLVTISLILTGLGVLAFFTSIIVAAFSDKMLALRENRTTSELERFKSFIIICGYGRVGQEIARQLANDRQNFIVIDKDESNINLARQQGFLANLGDVNKNDSLVKAGIKRGATAVLCVTGDDVTNVYITLSSRQLNADIQIISRANQPENIDKFYQAGADNVIEPFATAGLLAAEYIGQPVAFEVIFGILQEQKDVRLETIRIRPDSMLDNAQVGGFDFTGIRLTLVGVISANPIHLKHRNKYPLKQQHFYFNPDPHFILRAGDILVVLGRQYSIEHFRDQIEQKRLLKRNKV
ncbi:NAD-binding protein [Methylomarinum sp. Ch1-1]|uniref:BK channel n=1 Tax=Methylomarinum roseum TaxID=3067653 RepID=A0AAU7NWL9_9GAMM|nr:NAD-binding protein [Methylomarinum sp. Ch1-1]MDP4522626.1 NAD-binding protein [Methylomarinum sp. Ch1-1]